MHSEGKWFDDQGFWTTVRPAMFHRERRSRTQDEARSIARLLDLEIDASIVDVCCGFGRYSLAFAQLGYRVTAIDLCRPFLDELEADTRKCRYPVAAICTDVRQFRSSQQFDAAVSLFASCGYFENEEEDVGAMTNVFRHIRPGGQILVDSYSVQHIRKNLLEEYAEGNFVSRKIRTIDDRKTNQGSIWIDVEWSTTNWSDTERIERVFNIGHRIYTGFGIRRLLVRSGFTDVRLFKNYQGDPYSDDCDCEAVVALGKRPPAS